MSDPFYFLLASDQYRRKHLKKARDINAATVLRVHRMACSYSDVLFVAIGQSGESYSRRRSQFFNTAYLSDQLVSSKVLPKQLSINCKILVFNCASDKNPCCGRFHECVLSFVFFFFFTKTI